MNERTIAGDRPDLLRRVIAMALGMDPQQLDRPRRRAFDVGAHETTFGSPSAVGSSTSRCGRHSSGEITVSVTGSASSAERLALVADHPIDLLVAQPPTPRRHPRPALSRSGP